MSARVKELLEAATVLAGAGDRSGALRLVNEALRLSPDDARGKQLRDELSAAPGQAPTPFAPPPADLFADARPKQTNNPFARPVAPPATQAAPAATPPTQAASAVPAAAEALGDLLSSAMRSLGANPALDLPTGRGQSSTDPYAQRPELPPNPLDAPPSGGTLMFAQRPPSSPVAAAPNPLDATPSGGTLMFAQRPELPPNPLDAAPSGGTLMFAQRPPSSPVAAAPNPLDAAPSGGTLMFAQGPSQGAPPADLNAPPGGTTLPFAQRPSQGAPPADLSAPPGGTTLPFAQRPSQGAPPADMNAPPGGTTLPFAQRPGASVDLNAPPGGTTLPFAQQARSEPARPASSPSEARTGTLHAGNAPQSRPSSRPGEARTGTMIAGAASNSLESMLSNALGMPAEAPPAARPPTPAKARPSSGGKARPSSGGKARPSSGGKARPSSDPKARAAAARPTSDNKARPISDPKRAARPKSSARPRSKDSPAPRSSAPYDPMELIDEPPTPGTANVIDSTLRQARELLEFADHSGALELVEQVLASLPTNAEALSLKSRCEATLVSMFESKLGNLNKKPKLKLRPDEVIWLNLDHRAGFVLAQIDGHVSLEDLFDLSGMSRLDTARILAQLIEEKVVSV